MTASRGRRRRQSAELAGFGRLLATEIEGYGRIMRLEPQQLGIIALDAAIRLLRRDGDDRAYDTLVRAADALLEVATRPKQ